MIIIPDGEKLPELKENSYQSINMDKYIEPVQGLSGLQFETPSQKSKDQPENEKEEGEISDNDTDLNITVQRVTQTIQNEIRQQTGNDLAGETRKQIALLVREGMKKKTETKVPTEEIITIDDEEEESNQPKATELAEKRKRKIRQEIDQEEEEIIRKLRKLTGKSTEEIRQKAEQIKKELKEKEIQLKKLEREVEEERKKSEAEKKKQKENKNTEEQTQQGQEQYCYICQTFTHPQEKCVNCTYCKNEKAGHTARYCKKRETDKNNRERELQEQNAKNQAHQIGEILRKERERHDVEAKEKAKRNEIEAKHKKSRESEKNKGDNTRTYRKRLGESLSEPETEDEDVETEEERSTSGPREKRRTGEIENADGIFREFYKEGQTREFKIYLKQLNFLLFQCTSALVRNDNKRLYNCTICKNKTTRYMQKKQAIIHARESHGHLVPATANRTEQINAVHKMMEIYKFEGRLIKENYRYPCHKTNCHFIFCSAIEVFIHIRTEHEADMPEHLCFLCSHPVGDNTIENHWEKEHSDKKCMDPNCFNTYVPTLSSYLLHINRFHIEYLFDNCSNRTLQRLYIKCQTSENWIPAFRSMRALVFSENKNPKAPFPLYTKNFRRWVENLPAREDPFESFIIRKLNEKSYTKKHNFPIPDILKKLHEEMQEKTTVIDCLKNEPLRTELFWVREENAAPPFTNPFPLCMKCGDNEQHLDPRQCIDRSFTASHAPFISKNAEYEKMRGHGGTLLGVVHEAWGQTPILKKDVLFNASDTRTNVLYPTGRMGPNPIIYTQNEITTLNAPDYFSHCRQILGTLREHVREPILYEFYECHETTSKEEQENCVRGYLAGYLDITREFPYTSMILSPVPKPERHQGLGRYLSQLNKTKQITKILMAHATVLNIPVVPSEGYLYSSPQNKEMTKWKIYTGEGNDKILRNFDGSYTMNYLKRTGDLMDVILQQYRLSKREEERKNPQEEDREEIHLEEMG